MKRPEYLVLLLVAYSTSLLAGPGFATRDLNPVLQPVYLPSYLPLRDDDGWQVNHSFYLTNTSQLDVKSDERLVIDAENYRYELALGYRQDAWVVHANLPFISNRGGNLDGLIEDWHDFFGLPNGDRDKFADDQVELEYIRDGVVVFSETGSTSAVGDIAVTLGYRPSGQAGYFLGIELPTGSASDFTGNEAVDIALWMSRQRPMGENSTIYGMLGASFPGDDGDLEGLLVDTIWLAQLGLDYRFDNGIVATGQLDFHSRTVDDSDLDPFRESLQLQLGLGFTELFDHYRLDLYFSEDIMVGSAPDISMALRLGRNF